MTATHFPQTNTRNKSYYGGGFHSLNNKQLAGIVILSILVAAAALSTACTPGIREVVPLAGKVTLIAGGALLTIGGLNLGVINAQAKKKNVQPAISKQTETTANSSPHTTVTSPNVVLLTAPPPPPAITTKPPFQQPTPPPPATTVPITSKHLASPATTTPPPKPSIRLTPREFTQRKNTIFSQLFPGYVKGLPAQAATKRQVLNDFYFYIETAILMWIRKYPEEDPEKNIQEGWFACIFHTGRIEIKFIYNKHHRKDPLISTHPCIHVENWMVLILDGPQGLDDAPIAPLSPTALNKPFPACST